MVSIVEILMLRMEDRVFHAYTMDTSICYISHVHTKQSSKTVKILYFAS